MGGSSGPSATGGWTIAVVNDNSVVRSLLRVMLERHLGAGVVEGGDGLDAVMLRFADPPPDALIINGRMPRMDGVSAIAEIRRREAAEGRPRVLILFESGGDSDALVEAWNRGADAVMITPFRLGELWAALEPLVAGEERLASADSRAARCAEPSAAAPDAASTLLHRATLVASDLGAGHVGSEHMAMVAVDGPGGLADLTGRPSADLLAALAAPCGLATGKTILVTQSASRLAATAVRISEMRGQGGPDSSALVMALLNELSCVAWRNLAAVGVTSRGVEQAVRRQSVPVRPRAPQPDPREAASRAWMRASHHSD